MIHTGKQGSGDPLGLLGARNTSSLTGSASIDNQYQLA
jgi:hypothetical protein